MFGKIIDTLTGNSKRPVKSLIVYEKQEQGDLHKQKNDIKEGQDSNQKTREK